MAGDRSLWWIYIHKDFHGISQHKKPWEGFPFRTGKLSVFRNLEVIVTHIQQGTILGRLGFCDFVLEGHLILQSLCQFSNGFVDKDQKLNIKD